MQRSISLFESLRCIERPIWHLSWMCFFWSFGSLMVFSILPLFITEELGATKVQLGWIEGSALALSFGAKMLAGVWSDLRPRRTPVISFGILLTMGTKILFVCAHTLPAIIWARCTDRFSKGIRSSPSEALIADYSTTSNQGIHYGLRHSLYTLGAFMGILWSSLFLEWWPRCYREIFAIAAFFAAVSLYCLYAAGESERAPKSVMKKWSWRHIKDLPFMCWWTIGLLFFLMMARFSEMFLVLRAKDLGATDFNAVRVMLVFEGVYALTCYPAGFLADRFSRLTIMRIGIVMLLLGDAIMLLTGQIGYLWVGIAFGGLHLGLTQGIARAMIAQYTPKHLRGTAFSVSYMAIGISTLIANVVAGYSSEMIGANGPFLGGFCFAVMTLVWSSIGSREKTL